MNMTLIEIINDTDLPPSKKQQLTDAINELEALKALFQRYNRKHKYLVFKEDTSKQLKTKVFDVYNTFGDYVGHIRWDFVFQSYCYHAGGAFDPGCLFEAIVKMTELNEEKRKKSS